MNKKTNLTNEELRTKRKLAKKANFLKNAENSKKFYGRRYLGKTSYGKEIWITMRFDRSNMQISLEVNGLLDDLLDRDAALSPIRITQRLGNQKPNLDDFMRINRTNAGGRVTPRTIEYIKKLINAVNAKSSISHVDGKCSSLLFQYVSGIVFEGDTEELEGNYRWYDAVEQWGIPKGEYFIVDSF